MTKKERRERNKRELYGTAIFVLCIGAVLLLQCSAPIVLLIGKYWWVCGALSMLYMIVRVLKSKGPTWNDMMAVPAAVILGPVGLLFIVLWTLFTKLQTKRISDGSMPKST